jgi:hypothetical protein
MIVYDIEVVKSPVRGNDPKYQYADGWEDYKGMGIATLVIYDYEEDKTHTIMEEAFSDSKALTEVQSIFDRADVIVGFNILKFDNNLLRAHGIKVDDAKCYDILKQIWYANGLTGTFHPKTHGGYGLDTVSKANGGTGKSETVSGAQAPFLWQDGKRTEVVEYCIQDVMVTKGLLDTIFSQGGLINPKTKTFNRIAIPITL